MNYVVLKKSEYLDIFDPVKYPYFISGFLITIDRDTQNIFVLLGTYIFILNGFAFFNSTCCFLCGRD